MLKHEDNPQTQPLPAAQVRVTPEELAAAVTALQVRKEGQPGTIAIGDAVEELGLDVMPEEVLAEVQAKRSQSNESQKRLSPKKRLMALLAISVASAGLAIWESLPFFTINSRNLSADMTASPNTYVAAMPSSRPSSNPVTITLDPNLVVGDSSGKKLLLSEVGDNQPVHCDFNGSTFQQYTHDAEDWTLIKHDSKVYMRGWMQKASPAVIKTNGIDVLAVGNFGSAVPITLPLDGFKVTSDGNSNMQLHANEVHLDGHAYEKWQR